MQLKNIKLFKEHWPLSKELRGAREHHAENICHEMSASF
jgi:hypothetical protein